MDYTGTPKNGQKTHINCSGSKKQSNRPAAAATTSAAAKTEQTSAAITSAAASSSATVKAFYAISAWKWTPVPIKKNNGSQHKVNWKKNAKQAQNNISRKIGITIKCNYIKWYICTFLHLN